MNWKFSQRLLDALEDFIITLFVMMVFFAVLLSIVVGIVKVECDSYGKVAGLSTANTVLNCYIKQPDGKLVTLESYFKQIKKDGNE